MKTVKAWHFVGPTLRDDSPIPKDGVWLKHPGPVVICQSGFHASRDPFDALQYASGATLCRVELRGDIQEQNNKLVARERRIIARMDATKMLRYFARMEALSVVHLWYAPDLVLDYLMTGDENIRAAAGVAARAAAVAAAWDAPGAASGAAAWDAAWAAACSAAWAAACAAAGAAERDAAWAAKRDAAWQKASKNFNALVSECFEGVK